jgi:serine phosphatase RsbU (regulator of sigma subunit)
MKQAKVDILIVDDMLINREILLKIIKANTNYSAGTACSGDEAVRMTNELAPDLIILDIIMPDMDGFTVARKIKNDRSTANIPIIFITSLSDDESKIKAFSSGGIDYLIKPFSPKEVVSRITAHICLKRQYEEISRLHAQIMREIATAKKIQDVIIPHENFRFNNFSVYFKFITFEEVSGDYFDVIPIRENVYIVFMADVTGHGIPASLYTMALKSNLYYLTKNYTSPGIMMDDLNKDISRLLLDDFFPTAVMLEIDLNKMICSYANAGHPSPVYFSCKNKSFKFLEKKNFTLGLNVESKIEETAVEIKKGDRIYMYTDGLISCEDCNKKIINIDAAISYLKDNSDLEIEKQIEGLLDNIKKISKSDTDKFYNDDVTVLGIDIGK